MTFLISAAITWLVCGLYGWVSHIPALHIGSIQHAIKEPQYRSLIESGQKIPPSFFTGLFLLFVWGFTALVVIIVGPYLPLKRFLESK